MPRVPSTGQPLTFGLRAASPFAPRTKKQVPVPKISKESEGFYHGMSKGGIAGPAHC